jgi:hypothetical protein
MGFMVKIEPVIQAYFLWMPIEDKPVSAHQAILNIFSSIGKTII